MPNQDKSLVGPGESRMEHFHRTGHDIYDPKRPVDQE
jgi:hypothetical protein